VNITATAPTPGAGEQYLFITGWNGTGLGNYTGTTNASSVTMNGPIAESAVWTHQYYLTVSSVYATPGGFGWYDAGTNAYATVTPETIPVSPGIRILFSGWSNGATGSHSPSDPIYMDGPKTAVGSWGLSTYLTVISAHSTTSGEGWYNAWLPYTARAGVTDSIVTEGSTRYIFTGWSGDATGTHLISDNINMDWPRIATATWTTQFYLTVNNGHSTAGGAAWYDSSATAYASVADSIVTSGTTQYIFKQWTIDASGTYLTSNGILMDAAKTATATWTTQFYLTVNNGGHSTVGGAAWYDSSATAYATVTDSIVAGSAGTQYVFKQWTVDASGTHLTSNGILMDAPKTASVTWTTQYYLTLATLPPGITTPTGDGWYNASSLVPINTAPSVISLPDTYYFAKWTTGDMTEITDSLALSTTVFMDIPKTVTANYAQGSRDVGVDSIIQPADTVTICIPFNPVIRVVNNTFPSTVETCTLDVKIWRFRVKYDSLCHISVNVLDSVMLYDTSVVISIPNGFTNITLTKQWHPMFADLTYLSSPTYHRVRASVRMTDDANPSNDVKIKKFTVKDRRYDLQVNYAGLLRGKVLAPETITTGVAFNSFSVVSNSPSGPSVSFRSWFKIIKMKNNLPYYSQYIDRTLAAGTYACIYYSSGWIATDTGLYKVVSYIETRPGLDSVPGNNKIERYYYAARTSGSGPAGEVTTLPQTYGLMQNNPNPFSGLTAIRWQIPSESRVIISIYDATGRVIRTIENGNYLAGYYNSVWNCTDDHNRKVSAGIYFYELRANNYIARHKMVITR
jgi:hypothetical protein